MLTAQFVYESSVVALPKSERLKLAALILEELTATAAPALDFSDSWSEEDLRDLTAFSGEHAHERYPEETDHA
ncbi:MAG TPA: hypothetical protein VND64_31220 [Pirellulales bacterium]|nr:hypothetical protein [Pirellulales bacterium]